MDFKAVAEQLRKPEGDFGKKVAENMNISNALMNLAAIEKLQIQAGDNILEIGMGNGSFVKDILAKNPTVKYTGCDFSQTMVEESRLRNLEFTENRQADFLHANAGKLPFNDNYFTQAFCINTIYFWEKPSAELAEIHRVLGKNGKFIIGIRPKRSMEKYPFTPFGFTLYSNEDLKKLLKDNNFRVTETEEQQEPDQQIGEFTIQPEFLIVVAEAM
ncbi:MAG: class I SAM-dependent methyltransferase [Bacteroidia bacterium]